MYSTPLKSKIDKNKASYLLSLLLPGEEKIKFPFCTDLIIENSLYNQSNEHYFYDPYVIEFWKNYNNHRGFLYNTVLRHSRVGKDIINDGIRNIKESDPINRSSLLFLSNSLSEDHSIHSEVKNSLDMVELPKLFSRKNKIKIFNTADMYKSDNSAVVLECLVRNSHTKTMHDYFKTIIEEADNIYILSDNRSFLNQFQKHLHINDDYYLCYEKEKQ